MLINSKTKYTLVSIILFVVAIVQAGLSNTHIDSTLSFIESELARAKKVNNKNVFEAIEITSNLLQVTKELNNDSITNNVKYYLSLYYLIVDQTDDCLSVIEEIIPYYKIKNEYRYHVLKNRIATIKIRFGQYDEALSLLSETEKYFTKNKSKVSLGFTYIFLSDIYTHKSEYINAYKFSNKALKTFQEKGNYDFTSMAQTNLGYIHLLLKDYETASTYFEEIFEHRENIVSKSFLVRPLIYNGILKYEKGEIDEAKLDIAAGLESMENLGNFPDLSLAYLYQGKIAIKEKDYKKAALSIDNALMYASEGRNLKSEFEALLLKAEFESIVKPSKDNFNLLKKVCDWAKDNKDYILLESSTGLISDYFLRNNKLREALEYQKIANEASEKRHQKEKGNEITLLQEKNKFQEDLILKEAKEKELELNLQSKIKVNSIMTFGLTFLALLLFLVIQQFISKKKAFSKLKATHNELLAAEKVLDVKKTELEKYIESNIQLSQFAHIASHDLKSPLRTIVSFTGLLKRNAGDRLSQKEKDYMSFIQEATTELSDLVEDLLNLSKINSMSLKRSQLDVNELINKVLQNLSYDIESKGAIIDLDININQIFADPIQTKQLFLNFISNALKFSKENAVPHIKIDAFEKTNEWYFRIQDNGIGIEPQFHSKIFNDFERINNKSKYKGTGMGLSICKKIVEKHDGQIWVDSELGIGSTFHFTIGKSIDLSSKDAKANILNVCQIDS